MKALEGTDALVFMGGIGEHSARVRTETCLGLCYLGIVLEEKRNATIADDTDISADGALMLTLVIRTREERQLAYHAFGVLTAGGFSETWTK